MRKFLVLCAGLLALAGCGEDADEGGSGALSLSLSGEEAARSGYPVPGSEELAFADGWTLHFDKYLVSLGNVRLEGGDGTLARANHETVVVDLTAGEQHIFDFANLPARRWERFGYDIVAPTESTRAIGNIEAADLERMRSGGFNYLIEGTATKGDRTVRFDWGLANATRNTDCRNSADDTPGIVVRNNSTAEYQVTIHLDHLFYDRLGSHEGVTMRFEAIAATATDGLISFDALAEQHLADLRDADGNPLLDEHGARIVYDPGSVPLSASNLHEYLLAASESQGRFNGEGVCVNRALR